ncbi:MAG: Lrp/AsnC family transcriptional regulator [Chloroflexi bacterium]|jgi:Lrp/AsnC family transcriptional regulator, regulator for asnA, asnC and gidA|nr:Lrp/AsnC family transcriptional regulator [Chloroflexota bacterium]MBT7081068.1 Lrp/AsnC family transcriptional regulator [Chloroflexota bacterium]MBT7290393.1 Lrp/AsnC family transcriptional regulator [Chloroflexota bacterium]
MLDNLDLNIIQILEEDGRQRFVDIAARMGVAEGTIRKRVKKLLDGNIIKIKAYPNPKRLGFNVIAVMGLQVQMSALRHVAQILEAKPSVQWLAFVTGRYDMLALVIEKTTEDLSRFIEREISAIPSITKTETFINLDVVKGLMSNTIGLIESLKTAKR